MKEFFKPTKWKISLAISLLVLLIIIFYISLLCFDQTPEACLGKNNPITIITNIIKGTFLLSRELGLGLLGSNIIGLVTISLYCYLISCIIIYIYNKIKKK